MFKITNGQASAFNSSIIGKLFSDQSRQFPVADSFRLSDLVQLIQDRMRTYNEQVRKIVTANRGEILPDGRVDYEKFDDQVTANKQIMELNAVEIEIAGEKLKIKDDWPNLSLAEATILKAIIDEPAEEPAKPA